MTLKGPIHAICLSVMLGTSAATWSQSDTSNAQKIQALQKQLDDMKAQMDSVQAQILELSKSTQSAAEARAPAKSAVTATATAPPQEEGGASQAAALGVVPERQIGQTTATRQTDAQDPIAAPRIDPKRSVKVRCTSPRQNSSSQGAIMPASRNAMSQRGAPRRRA